jgi:alkylated DNA repair dioxygenase AlkB
VVLQPSLFEPSPEGRVDLPLGDDCVAWYLPQLFDADTSARLFDDVVASTPWRQDHLHVYGRQVAVPRLQSWHGDDGRTYTYSGIRLEAQPWTPPMLEVRAAVEAVCGLQFDSVLANQYRDGSDGVAWHRDDEPELGRWPPIASVSLGAPRRFVLRDRFDHTHRHELTLESGSLLVMAGATQHRWDHRVPTTRRPVGPRCNLTFRRLVDPSQPEDA